MAEFELMSKYKPSYIVLSSFEIGTLILSILFEVIILPFQIGKIR